MMTLNGIRNAIWCAVAFGIVACASAPMPEEFPVASNQDSGSRQLNRRVEIIVSNGDQAIPGRAVSGSP